MITGIQTPTPTRILTITLGMTTVGAGTITPGMTTEVVDTRENGHDMEMATVEYGIAPDGTALGR
jgi:hypothetical protein